jgi:uncharacterized membrane protein
MTARGDARPLIAAGVLLGTGLGGFVDGILFHQILQVHNMLSAKYPRAGVDAATALVNVEINMFWDGLFHAFTWATTALGLALLWKAVRRPDVPLSNRTFAGSLALGWGLFNAVEGLIDHQVLQIHHVVEAGPHGLWDAAFLASGVALILAGWAGIRAGRGEGSPGGTGGVRGT